MVELRRTITSELAPPRGSRMRQKILMGLVLLLFCCLVWSVFTRPVDGLPEAALAVTAVIIALSSGLAAPEGQAVYIRQELIAAEIRQLNLSIERLIETANTIECCDAARPRRRLRLSRAAAAQYRASMGAGKHRPLAGRRPRM